ncbi:MAG: tetratricopeptide repeat protein [Thermoguttaceae bacterium]
MRTLNVKRTVILLVVVIVVAGSTQLLHSYQLRRNSALIKKQATEAWKDKDNPSRVSDAIKLMNAYLVLEPKDYEAREELGQWYAESGRFANASSTLEELLRVFEKQNPPNLPKMQEVRRKLIEAAMAQGRCGDAVYHLEILKHELPDDVDVLYELGKCQINLGKLEGENGALANLSAAIAKAPDRVDIYYQKAMTLRNPPVQKQPEAEKCMAEMITYWEKDAANKDKDKLVYAHQAYGLWLDELEKHDEALKQAETMLALHKDYPAGLHLAGQSELAMRHFPKAEDYARRGIEAAPQQADMYTLMADVLVRTNQRNKAVEVLKKGLEVIQSKNDKATILWQLANFYLDGRGSPDPEHLAAAVDCIKRMREYHFPPEHLAFLDARVLYANEDWKAAREGFERVRPKLTDFPLLMRCLDFWIGDCYRQQGNPDQAMAAFRRSLSFDKFYYEAHDGIAQVFLEKRPPQFKDAVDEYRQAARGNPADPDVWHAFAQTLVRWNLRRSPTDQNWDEVQRVLDRAGEIAPNNGDIPLLRTEMLLARGQEKEAGDLLKALREGAPTGTAFWLAQANLAARRGKMDEARQILDEAKAKLGDQAPIRVAQAQLLLRELNLEAGAAIGKLAADVAAFSPKEKVYLWNGLLDYLLEIKEYDLAKQLCQQVAQLQPHDAKIRYQLLKLALRTHDARNLAASLAEVDRVLEEIEAIAGQGPLWLWGKAVRLSLEASRDKPQLLDAAMDYARQAEKQRLSWSPPNVLLGNICLQKGDEEEALRHYLDASINGDRDLEFIRVLLQMLYQRQRYQEAKQVIDRLETDQTPLSPEIKVQEADILSQWGDFDRALESASRAYNPASEDYRDHVWHGQKLTVLAHRGQQEGHLDKLPEITQQAEASLRRACLIAPNAPECRVALVQLLVATNQMEKAGIAASDAKEMIPPTASPLAMGYIYEALGKTEKAGQSYEKAVRLRPDHATAIRLLADFYLRNQQLQRAAPLIERLLSGEVHASESDLVGARRIKATILKKEGYPKFKEATELVDRNLASPLASAQDKRLKVSILLADPGRAYGPQVLELAESLVASGGAEPNPEDRFQLAQLYLARGAWERCRDQMEKLVNGSQSNPRYLAAYVRMLLDHDQLGDAEQSLERLERVSNTWRTVALRAELMFRSKKWADVSGFLDAYVSREKAEPQDPLDRILLAAQLIEDLGGRLTAHGDLAKTYFEKAGQWYERYNQKHKDGQMTLAAFDARHGKVSAAIELIEQFGAKAPPLELYNAAVALIRREGATPQQLLQVEKVLDNAAAAQEQSIPLLSALTELKISQEKFAEAEDLCRQMIAKDPANYLAYNNLGVLLALSGNKLDEALAMVNRAIDLAGPLPRLLDSRAVVHMARSEAAQALEDLQSIQADTIDPVWLFHKARALVLVGQIDEAVTAMAEARHKGLDRALIDLPERPQFDQLQQQLVKHEEQN